MRKTEAVQRAAVPHFGLYGESATLPEPGFVHIEDIATRSREVDWRIRPHRHGNLFQVVCVLDGSMEVQLDDDVRSISGTCAVAIPVGVVHGFHFHPDTRGMVLTMAQTILAGEDARRIRPYAEELFGKAQTIQFERGSVLLRQIERYLELAKGEHHRAESGREVMLEWLAGMVVMTLSRQLNQQKLGAVAFEPASDILTRFRDLLEIHYREHWPVQRYAAELNTSVSSLNRRCVEFVGLTAKTIIQNRLIVEAKRKLLYTQDSVDVIAYRLGFKDSAYFSRFFRKIEGVPPGGYRRNASRASQ